MSDRAKVKKIMDNKVEDITREHVDWLRSCLEEFVMLVSMKDGGSVTKTEKNDFVSACKILSQLKSSEHGVKLLRAASLMDEQDLFDVYSDGIEKDVKTEDLFGQISVLVQPGGDLAALLGAEDDYDDDMY